MSKSSAQHHSYSWELEEFYAACEDNDFWEVVKPNLCTFLDPVAEADASTEDAEEARRELGKLVDKARASLKKASDSLNKILAEVSAAESAKEALEAQQQTTPQSSAKTSKRANSAAKKLAVSLEQAVNKLEEVKKRKDNADHNKELAKAKLAEACQNLQTKEEETNQLVRELLIVAYTRQVAATKLEELRQKWRAHSASQEGILVADNQLVEKYLMGTKATRRVLITGKFSLTVGSARWMFGFSQEKAKDNIDYWLLRCNNYADLLKGAIGYGAPDVSNHLLGQHRDKTYFILSRHVVLYIARQEAAELVHLARNSSMQDNPAWKGWVFQLDFLTQLRLAATRQEEEEGLLVHKLNKGGSLVTETWPIKNRPKEYFNPTDLCGPKIEGTGVERFQNKEGLQVGDWLLPTRWNQGCFDIVQILEQCLRVVQITVAKTHSLKLRFIHYLVAQLSSMRSL